MSGCHLFVSGDVEHGATPKTCCSRKACCNYLYQQGTDWFLLMNIKGLRASFWLYMEQINGKRANCLKQSMYIWAWVVVTDRIT